MTSYFPNSTSNNSATVSTDLPASNSASNSSSCSATASTSSDTCSTLTTPQVSRHLGQQHLQPQQHLLGTTADTHLPNQHHQILQEVKHNQLKSRGHLLSLELALLAFEIGMATLSPFKTYQLN
jgi:hypothetical protein